MPLDVISYSGVQKLKKSIGTKVLTNEIAVNTIYPKDTDKVTVQGNLNVVGNVTYVETTNLRIKDNMIELNYGETGSGVTLGLAGISIDRGTLPDAQIVFLEGQNKVVFKYENDIRYAIDIASLQIGGIEVLDYARNLKNVYIDAGLITSGVLSIDRIPNLPRSKITDFFSSPFWNNIPDKPFSGLGPEFMVSNGNLTISSIDFSKITNRKTSLLTVDSGLIPNVDNQYSLGNSSYRWASAYIVNLYTGDIKLMNNWVVTERDENGNIIPNGVRILNDRGEEIFKITEDGIYFKGRKLKLIYEE